MGDKQVVVKHSAAIQWAGQVSLLERKTWNLLLANAFDDLEREEVYSVPIRDLLNYFKSNNISYLKDALRRLNVLQVEWNVLGRDKQNQWGVYTLLAQAKIVNGICFYSYAPDLRRMLNNPTVYAKINLLLQGEFKGKFSLPLYELAVDYFRTKERRGETQYISLVDLRRILGLKENEYIEFKEFSRYCIKKSVNEINKKTDLEIEAIYKRERRRVVAIKFIIKPNRNYKPPVRKFTPAIEQIKLPFKELEIENQDLFQVLLTEFGVSTNKAHKILTTHDEFYIDEVLETVRISIKKGTVNNIPAYTVKAIEDDYRSKKSAHDIEQEEKQEKARKARETVEKAKAEEDAKRMAEIKEGERIDAGIEKLPKKEREKLEKEARQIEIDDYKKKHGKKVMANHPSIRIMSRLRRRKLYKERYES